jgi:hypothetical protein
MSLVYLHCCCGIRSETYHMIDSCDPTIASWSNDGLSFVIHDVANFTDVRTSNYNTGKFVMRPGQRI